MQNHSKAKAVRGEENTIVIGREDRLDREIHTH